MTADTLPLEGLARPLLRLSPSALDAWRDCPRRYRHAYVDRPPPPRSGASAHFSLGVSVHNALRDWWLGPPARRTAGAAASLVDLAWVGDGYRDDTQSAAWRSRARTWVADYVSGLDPAAEPFAVERKVVGLYRDNQFFGRLDRLDERPDGSLVVVDYKTGRSGVSADEARGSWALAVYAYAAERTLRRPVRRVELHHVPSGEVVAHEHTVESLRRHLDRMSETAEEVRAAKAAVSEGAEPDAAYPAVAGPRCGWCEFHRSCPAGRAAVPRAREPWAGLGEEVAAAS
ncbi:MAG TPA: PD-(D/E)XK nuclease family protein [Mycobacteriales bacterium]|jgi:RecB family exonuclease